VITRPATPDDIPQLAANVAAGFDTYRAFAGEEWEPPAIPVAEQYGQEGTWCLVGDENGGVVGHVLFGPAITSRGADEDGVAGRPIPGLAHLYHLFVRQSFWGTGLAKELLDGAVDEMEARGYTQARLFTPAGQVRARRFYAREGWALAAEPVFEPFLGLDIVELRRWIGT
jgi:GNAT superfamily N-acetyltransferase